MRQTSEVADASVAAHIGLWALVRLALERVENPDDWYRLDAIETRSGRMLFYGYPKRGPLCYQLIAFVNLPGGGRHAH